MASAGGPGRLPGFRFWDMLANSLPKGMFRAKYRLTAFLEPRTIRGFFLWLRRSVSITGAPGLMKANLRSISGSSSPPGSSG